MAPSEDHQEDPGGSMSASTMTSVSMMWLQLPPAAPPTEFYRELSRRVRQIRLELGILSQDAAQAAGMLPSNYSQFEAGKQRVSVQQFFNLQRFFASPPRCGQCGRAMF